MTESATKNRCEIFQSCLQHPPGKLEFPVFTRFGSRRKVMGIYDSGWQGSPGLDFMEVIGFVEREHVHAYGRDASGQRFEESGGMARIQ